MQPTEPTRPLTPDEEAELARQAAAAQSQEYVPAPPTQTVSYPTAGVQESTGPIETAPGTYYGTQVEVAPPPAETAPPPPPEPMGGGYYASGQTSASYPVEPPPASPPVGTGTPLAGPGTAPPPESYGAPDYSGVYPSGATLQSIPDAERYIASPPEPPSSNTTAVSPPIRNSATNYPVQSYAYESARNQGAFDPPSRLPRAAAAPPHSYGSPIYDLPSPTYDDQAARERRYGAFRPGFQVQPPDGRSPRLPAVPIGDSVRERPDGRRYPADPGRGQIGSGNTLAPDVSIMNPTGGVRDPLGPGSLITRGGQLAADFDQWSQEFNATPEGQFLGETIVGMIGPGSMGRVSRPVTNSVDDMFRTLVKAADEVTVDAPVTYRPSDPPSMVEGSRPIIDAPVPAPPRRAGELPTMQGGRRTINTTSQQVTLDADLADSVRFGAMTEQAAANAQIMRNRGGGNAFDAMDSGAESLSPVSGVLDSSGQRVTVDAPVERPRPVRLASETPVVAEPVAAPPRRAAKLPVMKGGEPLPPPSGDIPPPPPRTPVRGDPFDAMAERELARAESYRVNDPATNAAERAAADVESAVQQASETLRVRTPAEAEAAIAALRNRTPRSATGAPTAAPANATTPSPRRIGRNVKSAAAGAALGAAGYVTSDGGFGDKLGSVTDKLPGWGVGAQEPSSTKRPYPLSEPGQYEPKGPERDLVRSMAGMTSADIEAQVTTSGFPASAAWRSGGNRPSAKGTVDIAYLPDGTPIGYTTKDGQFVGQGSDVSLADFEANVEEARKAAAPATTTTPAASGKTTPVDQVSQTGSANQTTQSASPNTTPRTTTGNGNQGSYTPSSSNNGYTPSNDYTPRQSTSRSRSSTTARGSVPDFFSDGDVDFDINDFLNKDYDGDGKVTNKDRAEGKRRFNAAKMKRRGKKASSSTLPQFQTTPMREQILATIDTSMNKKKR
jgi:hypothetical protein